MSKKTEKHTPKGHPDYNKASETVVAKVLVAAADKVAIRDGLQVQRKASIAEAGKCAMRAQGNLGPLTAAVLIDGATGLPNEGAIESLKATGTEFRKAAGHLDKIRKMLEDLR